MTIAAENRTPAALARRRGPEVPKAYTEDQKRDRRRRGLIVTLDSRFSLTDETLATCSPLARRITTQPFPERWWRLVDALAEAVHGVAHVGTGLLAEVNVRRSTRGQDVSLRSPSIRAARDLAERPRLASITDEMLADGTWPKALADMVKPLDKPLADLLGIAATSAPSDRLLHALREVDLAELDLRRKLDKADRARQGDLG